jgi:hypothetical protein
MSCEDCEYEGPGLPTTVKYVMDTPVPIVRAVLDFHYEIHGAPTHLVVIRVDLGKGHVDLDVHYRRTGIGPDSTLVSFRQPISNLGGACVEVALQDLAEEACRYGEMFGGGKESFSRSQIGACVLDVIGQFGFLRTGKKIAHY